MFQTPSLVILALIVGVLFGCASSGIQPSRSKVADVPHDVEVARRMQPFGLGKSQWRAAEWSELQGLEADSLNEAWNAWLKSCERPLPAFSALCKDIRRLSIGNGNEQRAWMHATLQPYRSESLSASGANVLTGYFEPVLEASRVASPLFNIPVYRVPTGLSARKPWFTRQEADSLNEPKLALRDRAIAYLASPVDAMILQTQGSGRLNVREPDGSVQVVRLSYAGSNDQPFRSIGRWLLEQGAVRDASWAGIHAWFVQNPHRANELLWANPRMVFFREDSLAGADLMAGPRGAQGVSLTPGRSIAVDAASIPVGAPVWISSRGPLLSLDRLVMAQDTGVAIQGALRADYFVGWDRAAADVAGRLKQPLKMWVLWPRGARLP